MPIKPNVHLSPREWQVYTMLVATSKESDEIGAELGIAPNTIKAHLRHIYARCQVRGRIELMLAYWQEIDRDKQRRRIA